MRFAVIFLLVLAACATDAGNTTTVEATTTTAYKLPPVDSSLSETEAEYVESLRLWSITQRDETTVDLATDLEIADFGNALCEGVGTVVEGGAEERILDFYDTLKEEMEGRGFSTDSYSAMFARAIFILCPEYREATAALLDE